MFFVYLSTTKSSYIYDQNRKKTKKKQNKDKFPPAPRKTKKKKKNQVHPQCLATKPSEFILPPSSKVFWG